MSFVRAIGLACLLLSVVGRPEPAAADADDVLAGAFDATTGVPFASTMLGIVRSGEEVPTTPSVLDQRLAVVERLLADMEPRLAAVEQRLAQLTAQVAKDENRVRLTELQRLRLDLVEINHELQSRPANPDVQRSLVFRAQADADALRDSVDFDVWKWSSVTPADQTIRIRFVVYPSFELYGVAIATWFSAIDLRSHDNPQQVVADSGPALLLHAAFLMSRIGFAPLVDDPVSLDEHLRTAGFCRLEAVDQFANAAGQCVFATECVDTMTDKTVETGRETLAMNPPRVGTLCTTSPAQSVGLQGEQQLQNMYGAQVMAALAHDLDQLGHTGSLRPPFVGTFGNFIDSQIFSVPLDAPLMVGSHAVAGARPGIPGCARLVGGGCVRNVTLSRDTAWELRNPNPSGGVGGAGPVTLRQIGSGLCLDIKGGVATPGAVAILFSCNATASQVWAKRVMNNVDFMFATANNLCATVEPAMPSNVVIQLSRGLVLQPCDGRTLQHFSGTDSHVVGPR